MNKLPIIAIVALILAPSAFALALGIPNVGELIFEPNKEVNLEYILQNNLPTQLPVKAVLNVPPELSEYVTLSKDVTTIAPGSMEHIVVTIKFPHELPYGLYSIGFTAVEDAPTQGAFVAHVGASHTVKILNPYPDARLLLEYKGPATLQASGISKIEAGVRNIGNENLTETRLHVTLSAGNTTQEAYSDRVTIPALEEKTVMIPFDINVPPGIYTIKLNSTKGEQEGATKQIQVGNPTVSITSIGKYSFEIPSITVGIKNTWQQPLTEGTLALTVYQPNTTRALFEASATSITLQPGENTVSLRVQKPRFLNDGMYPASLQVLAPPFYIGADTELEIKQSEVGRMLKDQQEAPPEEAWQYENVTLDQPRVMRVAKNKQLYAVILIIVIAIFLFSLAMLLRKKKEQNAQTQQDKT